MNIIEQIKALPEGKTVIHNLDKNALSAEFDMTDLKALAESHERLLAVLKDVLPGLPETYGDESIEAMNAIEQAEQI